jgi:6,7-dimethyl-8-ribityllumazine synthase
MSEVTKSKLLQTGILNVQDACIVLVKTEWNAAIVDELEKGCIDELKKHNVKKIITVTVPGAFEIPFAILSYLENTSRKKRPDAFIAIGCVIRGETAHFDYICKGVTDGIMQLNLSLPMPTVYGILTVENESQAKDRIGGQHGHKGTEAALTALKMISLNQTLKK